LGPLLSGIGASTLHAQWLITSTERERLRSLTGPLIWVFRGRFCTHEGTLPYRSSAQISCREEVGVSFVVLGVLEPQIARHWFRSAAISRHLTNSVGRSLL
jgi:hypothetical protein